MTSTTLREGNWEKMLTHFLVLGLIPQFLLPAALPQCASTKSARFCHWQAQTGTPGVRWHYGSLQRNKTVFAAFCLIWPLCYCFSIFPAFSCCRYQLNIEQWHWKSFRWHEATLPVLRHNKLFPPLLSPTLTFPLLSSREISNSYIKGKLLSLLFCTIILYQCTK